VFNKISVNILLQMG